MKLAARLLPSALVLCCSLAAAQAQTVRPVMPPPETMRPAGVSAHSTAQGGAQSKTPPLTALPDFTALDLNGHTVSVASLAKPGRWLLLYVRKDCASCAQELQALAGSGSPGLLKGAPYVILLAKGAAPNGLDALKAKYPGLADATWLEDRSGAAGAALKPAGAPILYGVEGTAITFVLPGSMGSPANAERMAGSWLTGQPNALAMAAASAARTKAASASPASSAGKTIVTRQPAAK